MFTQHFLVNKQILSVKSSIYATFLRYFCAIFILLEGFVKPRNLSLSLFLSVFWEVLCEVRHRGFAI